MTDYELSRWLILIVWLSLWFLLSYNAYYQFRRMMFSERWFSLKIMFYCLILIFLTKFLIYREIDIYINVSDESYIIAFLWTLMNSILLYMMLNIIGFFRTQSNKLFEFSIVFFILFLSIQGFGYLGLKIVINDNCFIALFLKYQQIQTNSYKMIKFFMYNILYLILLIFISTIVEREI